MKKRYIAPLVYAATLWIVGLFIFGESGVVDTNFKNAEILRLKSEILRSGMELDSMVQRHKHLKNLREPDQAFLAQVDRKIGDVVVYKFPAQGQSPRAVSAEARRLTLQTAVMVGAFLLVGLISITALTFSLNPGGRR